jgi:alkylated DNA repair dioxygenase AlkB
MPGFITPTSHIEQLSDTLTLKQTTIRIFGKTHLTPRLIAWYGTASYAYSGQTHPPAAMPKWLTCVQQEIERHTGARFNSVLANYYRDGRDSVSWHADDEPELGAEPTIASLSFGASRYFAIRARSGGAQHKLLLKSGDLVVMRGRSQLDYLHSIPKTTIPCGSRLNLTFRYIFA